MRLHYSTSGDVGNPAIVFLHGFMGSGDDWSEISTSLEHEFFTVRIDLPGHGRSTGGNPENYTFAETADSILTVLDNLAIERTAILAGYSMGGRIAIYTAIRHTVRFGTLVLESASPGLKTEAERSERKQVDNTRAEMIADLGMRRFVDLWYDMPLFENLRSYPKKLAQLKGKLESNAPAELAKSLEHAGTGVQPSLWQRLDEIEIPVLLICGELDTKFCAINSEMSRLINRAKLAIVTDAGHNVHLERPDEYLRLLREFSLHILPS